MNENRLLNALSQVDEQYIVESEPLRQERRRPAEKSRPGWMKWGAVAACLALILTGGLLARNYFSPPSQAPQPGPSLDRTPVSDDPLAVPTVPDNVLNINELTEIMGGDMDVRITSYNGLSGRDWDEALEAFRSFMGISYDSFIGRLPADFLLTSFYSLSTPERPGSSEADYKIHDYVFEYSAPSGGCVTIALCPFEAPLRDCFFSSEDAVTSSHINGTPLTVYGYEDLYMAQFSYDSVFYDLSTGGLSASQLESLLGQLLPGQESPDK